MILIQNALRFMCYFITFSSFYYPRKDYHAFRIELKHTSYVIQRSKKLCSLLILKMLQLHRRRICTESKANSRRCFFNLSATQSQCGGHFPQKSNDDLATVSMSWLVQNGDGEMSKAEIKLAHKQLTMKQIEEIMRLIDENHDGRISLEEFNHSA